MNYQFIKSNKTTKLSKLHIPDTNKNSKTHLNKVKIKIFFYFTNYNYSTNLIINFIGIALKRCFLQFYS